MKTFRELQEDKELARAAIRRCVSGNIIGVALDPIAMSLVIIHDYEREEALLDLRRILNRESILGVTFQKRFSKRLEVSRLMSKIDEREIEIQAGDVINPEDGDPGRAGCIVTLEDGTEAVLTAGHIFYQRGKERVCYQDDSYCSYIGDFKLAGGPDACPTVSLVDCAIFRPSRNVKPKQHAQISGSLDVKDLQQASLTFVNRLGGKPAEGQILDTDSTIKYEAHIKDGWYDVVLDSQIFIKSVSKDALFGVPGDSGSPILVASGQRLRKGAVVGLYTATGTGDYHFASPIDACLTAVGATGLP